MGFILAVSGRVKRMSILVICGIMIGYICSAVTDFVVTFADDSNIVNLHNWSMGSFSGMTWDNVAVMAAVVLAAFAGAFLLSKPISAYQLGEVYARNMGVNIRAFRLLLILLSSILSACVYCFRGPDFFCGDRGAPPGKKSFKDGETDSGDSRLLPGGRSLLPFL